MNCLNGSGRGGGQGTSGGGGQWQKISWTQCCRIKCQPGVAALSCTNVRTASDMHREGELSEGEQGDKVDLSASPTLRPVFLLCWAPHSVFIREKIPFRSHETSLSICLQKDTTEVNQMPSRRDRKSVHTSRAVLSFTEWGLFTLPTFLITLNQRCSQKYHCA